jgi:hypothetical protein
VKERQNHRRNEKMPPQSQKLKSGQNHLTKWNITIDTIFLKVIIIQKHENEHEEESEGEYEVEHEYKSRGKFKDEHNEQEHEWSSRSTIAIGSHSSSI